MSEGKEHLSIVICGHVDSGKSTTTGRLLFELGGIPERELEKLKEEKHDAVADVLSAREEKQIADMVNGISNDKTAADLQRLREMRQKASASARVSREMAGLDAKRAETEFLEYAQQATSDDEFDALIGLSKDKKGSFFFESSDVYSG